MEVVSRKRKIDYISNEKTRGITFKSRKTSLMKKMYEFSTLCGVDACLILYGPNQNGQVSHPEIWPQNPVQYKPIIQRYQEIAAGGNSKQPNCPSEISGQGSGDLNIDCSRKLSMDELSLMMNAIDSKIQMVNSKIEMLKADSDDEFSGLLQSLLQDIQEEGTGMDSHQQLNSPSDVSGQDSRNLNDDYLQILSQDELGMIDSKFQMDNANIETKKADSDDEFSDLLESLLAEEPIFTDDFTDMDDFFNF